MPYLGVKMQYLRVNSEVIWSEKQCNSQGNKYVQMRQVSTTWHEGCCQFISTKRARVHGFVLDWEGGQAAVVTRKSQS